MDSLGLTVHPDKSVLLPCKQITFLGFVLCSETMSVTLTLTRRDELIYICHSILGKFKVNNSLNLQNSSDKWLQQSSLHDSINLWGEK